MIIHLLQHIITLIPIIIALVIQMIVHHLPTREDVMVAVVVEIKKALLFKGLLISLR